MSGGITPYVRVDAVGKTFNPGPRVVHAIRAVTFNVTAGEFVSILGPSGCGKSTLLMMIAGLEMPTTGRIEVEGRPIVGPRADIGVMFQDPVLLPWKSALDNVLFPIRILKRPMTEYRQKALELLELTGLLEFQHQRPHQLSGGMKQRVSICRALVYDPKMLLMDEPFSALDAITRDEMNEALVDIWQRYRKTAVFVTHSIREAVFLSDRVLVMTGRPSSIIADVPVPFPRPRRPEIGETVAFNELCARLRAVIERTHKGVPRTTTGDPTDVAIE